MNVHYIYINRSNKYDDNIPEQVRQLKDLYCKRPSGECLDFCFWTYSAVQREIHAYDKELGRLFSLIDPDFGACMADIGRIFCIYKQGGIYHDAHVYINDSDFLETLISTINQQGKVIEKHPSAKASYGCRNKNIAGMAGEDFFRRVLNRMKNNLLLIEQEILHAPSSRHNMWKVTTMAFLDQLFEDAGLEAKPYDIRRVPGYQNFVMPYKIAALPKFYNNGMSNHWSTLQELKPILALD